MTASDETWKSYAQLLARLSPRISHVLFAGADGSVWWCSEPPGEYRLQQALTLLLRPHPPRHSEFDGVIEADNGAESRYGFRIRGALGDLLGLLVIALPQPEAALHWAAVHALIKPVLDCIQNELCARAAIGELHEDLADSSREPNPSQRLSEACADGLEYIAALANDHLSGTAAVILLPDRNLTLYRGRDGTSAGIEHGVLAQMHRHLTTRAQLHGRTLVANHLAPAGSDAAVPYKAIFTPIRDEARRVAGVLAVLRAASEADFQQRDAQALELLARKAAQSIRSSFDPLTGLLSPAAFGTRTAMVFCMWTSISSAWSTRITACTSATKSFAPSLSCCRGEFARAL